MFRPYTIISIETFLHAIPNKEQLLTNTIPT